MILRNCSIFSRVTWSWSSTEGCRFQSPAEAVLVAACEAAAEAAEAAEAVPRLPDATVELVSGKKRQNRHVRYLIQFAAEEKM